jgi:putative copper resistance protein D
MIDVLVAARALHFASTAAATGVTIFHCLIAEPAVRRAGDDKSVALQSLRSKLRHVLWVSLAFVVVSGAVWLIAVAGNVSDQPLMSGAAIDASSILLTRTQFGHAWIARLVFIILLLGSALLEHGNESRHRVGEWLSTLSAICLVGSLAWSGHAGGTPGASGAIHVVSDFLHLVAAAAWLGGLLPLALLFALAGARGDRSLALLTQIATLRFSMLGVVCVAILVVSGLVNAWVLVDGLRSLVETAYGKLLLAKIAVFIAMIGLAAVNRFRLTPGLPDPTSMRLLRRNAIIEIGLGLIVLAIVAELGVLPPAAHANMQMP